MIKSISRFPARFPACGINLRHHPVIVVCLRHLVTVACPSPSTSADASQVTRSPEPHDNAVPPAAAELGFHTAERPNGPPVHGRSRYKSPDIKMSEDLGKGGDFFVWVIMATYCEWCFSWQELCDQVCHVWQLVHLTCSWMLCHLKCLEHIFPPPSKTVAFQRISLAGSRWSLRWEPLGGSRRTSRRRFRT